MLPQVRGVPRVMGKQVAGGCPHCSRKVRVEVQESENRLAVWFKHGAWQFQGNWKN